MLLYFRSALCALPMCFALIILFYPASTSMGEIGDLTHIIPTPYAPEAKGWGGTLEPVSSNTILVAGGGSFTVHDGPVHLLDVSSGTTIQTYVEPTEYPNASDRFGSSVAYVGNHVLVGALGTDLDQPIISDAGVVHVYDATTGVYQRTINNPNPVSSGSFGVSIAPVGNFAIVGTFKDRSSNGAAYLIDPSTGNIVTKFENPTNNRGDNFGSTVAAIGTDVLIATRNTANVYRFDSSTGQLKHTYTHPNEFPPALFGFDIISTADKIIIGAFKDRSIANEAGAVYVYDADTGTLLRTLISPTIFGRLVRLQFNYAR